MLLRQSREGGTKAKGPVKPKYELPSLDRKLANLYEHTEDVLITAVIFLNGTGPGPLSFW